MHLALDLLAWLANDGSFIVINKIANSIQFSLLRGEIVFCLLISKWQVILFSINKIFTLELIISNHTISLSVNKFPRK